MNNYNFTLIYALSSEEAGEQYLDALFEAGCDDALIGVGTSGRIAFEFDREAETPLEAVVTAQENVKAAIPHARLVSAAPDLVNLSQVAELLNVSRQYIQQLQYKVEFPQPVLETSTPVYHLHDVIVSIKPKFRSKDEILAALQNIGLTTRYVNHNIEEANLSEIDTLSGIPIRPEAAPHYLIR